MKNIFTLIIFLLVVKIASAQNEANNWFFPDECGLDFNSGTPVVLDDGQIENLYATATISDSLGNYLLSCEWSKAYTKFGILDNSETTLSPGFSGLAIAKWPGRHGIYFIITSGIDYNPNPGLHYSIVDLNVNNGLGSVIEKDIPVESCWDSSDRVCIVNEENSDNVWVITRKFIDDAMVSYLIDENGFHNNPVISMIPDRDAESDMNWGWIKISSDKKYLVSSYKNDGKFEVCRFHAETGKSEYLYTQISPVFGSGCNGIEFSPDSKYLFVCYSYFDSPDTSRIYQYDVHFISDSALFASSAVIVGTGSARALQIARDGKIYCSPNPVLPEVSQYYLSVIHKPWIRGIGCMFENNVINMYPNRISWNLPNILIDYLLRFEWSGEQCQGYAIQFEPNFIPTPQTIKWDFDDGGAPGSISWELSPTYSFQNPGVHEVKVDVWYPSGRYEHTSREIEINPSPQPDLGPDTLICEGSSITLNANCEADVFSWSTSQFGVSSITVSDSGTYWVRGKFNDSGCIGYDTIHIGFHTPTIIDETNLVIIPTTCNGASGSISGLTALGSSPYAFQWFDLSSNSFGTNIDATNLPAGQYQLTITDGNGCETVSDIYTIEDAGNLQVLDVELTQPHCGRLDGRIIVHAFSPSGSALQYSIDDGLTYQADSVFSDLFGTSYVVRVSDVSGCFGFYPSNPVVLADIPGPQVTEVNITDETDFLGNGAIEIVANGSTPVIYYSIDSGATWQQNNGYFDNLISNNYYIIIKDDNDCDTTFTVEIQNIILTYLHAVTNEGGHCLGNTAMVPVNVDNFNSVATFHLKLSYNADNLQCEGFTNVHPQLIDSLIGWVDQAAGIINLVWNSPSPVTFTQSETVAELVFTTKNPGQGELAWYTGETESYFTNSSGNPIPAEFQTGEVNIYELPDIILDQSKTVCTGQFVSIMSIALGNQPPIDYQWIYPDGDTTSNDPFFFSVSQVDAGLYTLLASDRVGCTDSKSIELIVSENPVATFHGTDTLEMHNGDVLDAGTGLSSYLWNTGDSTESTVITVEGLYIVKMESPVGCLGSDSVYVKLVSEGIPDFEIYIPNAFSPNGDGVNDFFQVMSNGLPIFKFQFSIFDRWGGEVFSSSGIENGWDGKKNGKDCPGGVYVYKIVFSVDGVPGSQERVGTVMLVR